MKRRDFLKSSSLAAGFTLGTIPVWASHNMLFDVTDEDTILVVVQLFGGNDGLNTVIPADNDLYYSKYRKKTSLAKNLLVRVGNSNSYLNPAMLKGAKNGLKGLYDEGKLAIIQGVGYPNNNLSHFRSTDIWLSGQVPADDSELLSTGWLGRYTDNIGGEPVDPPCMNIGNESSLLFQSAKRNTGISIEDPNQFYEGGKGVISGESTQAGTNKFTAEYNYLIDLGILSNKYSQVVKAAFDKGKNASEYASGKLSDELKLVAKLISGGLKTKVYMVSLDGFDTHANQGSLDGVHAGLLRQVSESISHFMADLKAQKLSNKVVGMTVSEFGRRPNENESLGSDHGSAGVMFMFGDAVKGDVYGKAFDFSDLDKNKDFNHQYDYRAVYDEVLSKWLPSSSNTASQILGKKYAHINGSGILRTGGTQLLLSVPEPRTSLAYPNPALQGTLNLKFQLARAGEVSLAQNSTTGRRFSLMQNIPFPTGMHDIPVQLIGGPGVHILELLKNGQRETFKVIWP